MELSLLLAKQIIIMFSMLLVGFVLVRSGILKPEDGTPLSRIVIYVILPCAIINSFQVTYSRELAQNLLLAFGTALLCNLILVALSIIAGKILQLDGIEKASLAYPNAGDLLFPLVTSILGAEWKIYCCAFMTIQIILLFTVGKMMLQGKSQIGVKEILQNPPVIATLFSLVLFVMRLQLPEMLTSVTGHFGNTLAPLSMLVIGIAIGKLRWTELLRNGRYYMICLIRLIVMPILILGILKMSNLNSVLPEAKNILLIVFLACSSSSAATIVQLAQNAGKDSAKASAINLMSVLMLVVTMPVMVFIFGKTI